MSLLPGNETNHLTKAYKLPASKDNVHLYPPLKQFFPVTRYFKPLFLLTQLFTTSHITIYRPFVMS